MPKPQVAGVTVCKSGPIRDNVASIVQAGSIQYNGPATTFSIALPNLLHEQPSYASVLAPAISPNSSGNLGTQKVWNHLKFAYQTQGNYVIAKVSTSLAGSGTLNGTIQAMGTSDRKGLNPARFYAYQRLNITGWSYVTGAATEGSDAGVTILASGINGVTGVRADKAVGFVDTDLRWLTQNMQGGVLPSSLTLPTEFNGQTHIG